MAEEIISRVQASSIETTKTFENEFIPGRFLVLGIPLES
jgi:hypothetical protein